jgi:molybdopterin converting factor subunit 1
VRVTILYFAVLRELVGLEREEVVLPAELDRVGRLAAWLERRHAGLAGRLNAVRFAVDEEFAAEAHPLREGAVVALIPPVAGG